MHVAKGVTLLPPFSSAGILGLLTFTLVGPLIAFGNKKTLTLRKTYREKLEADCGAVNDHT